MDLKELLSLLEERLSEHNTNRKEVQSKLKEMCSKKVVEANSLEEKINEEIQCSFNSTEERILAIIEKLNSNNNKKIIHDLIKQAQRELSTEVKFEIKHIKDAENFSNSYKLKLIKVPKENKISNEGSVEHIINELQTYVNKTSESMSAAQDKMAEICAEERKKSR